jgi:hypothetical protein
MCPADLALVEMTAASAQAEMSLDEANTVYTAYRSYVVHEDDLVHQWTTWSIAIQTFAVATFGLIYQRQLDALVALSGPGSHLTPELTDLLINQYRAVLFLVASFGLGVSAISGVAVYAAQRSIKHLEHRWYREHARDASICHKFPQLTGGGNRIALLLGHCLPLGLPVFFVIFWVITIIYVAH